MAVGELSCSVLMVVGGEMTSTMPSPVCGTLVFIMCLCKCFIQSSWTDKGPWKTRSQNLRREEETTITKVLFFFKKLDTTKTRTILIGN